MLRFAHLCNSNSKTQNLASYLLELGLVEYKMTRYSPSLQGASAIYLANKILNNQDWNAEQQLQSKYSVDQLQQCSKDLFTLLEFSMNTGSS